MFYKKNLYSFLTYFFQNLKRHIFDKVAIIFCFVKVQLNYSSLLICNRAVTNMHVVDIPPMLVNLDRVFPFFPSRLQLGWCFFNFSSCDFFISEGYLVPCLKCNNDSHRGYYLDGVFSKRPLWLLIGLCFPQKFQGGY